MTTTTEFKPTETWSERLPAFGVIENAIYSAREVMNQKNPEQLVDSLKNSVQHSERGIAFAILKGDQPEEYSDTDALVMFNPFANVATPNMLVRTEFLREVAKFADVRDEHGKLKPVIMLASPGMNSKLKLGLSDRLAVMKGELGPVAKELLHAISEKEIGKVSLLGFSQGADVALAGARSAYSANLDTKAVSVGDPAGVMDRSPIKLAKDFGAASPDLEAAANRTGLIPLNDVRGKDDYARFAISALHPINWLVLGRALGRNSFEASVQEILDEGKVDKLVVGYGGKSTIARPEAIEPAIQRLYDKNGRDSFISIKVDEAMHSWGDQLTLLAKLYMRALT